MYRKSYKKTVSLLMAVMIMLTGCASPGQADTKEIVPAPETETAVNMESEAASETLGSGSEEESENNEASETSAETEATSETAESAESEEVILGDEQFDEYIPLLEGKKVALFSNHTGIVGDETSGIGELEEGQDASLIHFGYDKDGNEISYGTHILDALIEKGVNVTAIFSPEHGFRGNEDAGAEVDNSVDEKTGVPILSLYGSDKKRAPADEDMAKFDTLVIDMQDVGLRFYTYYISMYYLIDACAAEGKEVILLDRPNPNGFYVDGPILQEEYKSGVGALPIPVVYGMTWGELAQMIN
ncbi:MAG: DUF1343 domain-containing protein, partial [Lachnospiraceae bacterium]|nr:DUF1343 domain-containing protein [Lachnospiraceae bacterium]